MNRFIIACVFCSSLVASCGLPTVLVDEKTAAHEKLSLVERRVAGLQGELDLLRSSSVGGLQIDGDSSVEIEKKIQSELLEAKREMVTATKMNSRADEAIERFRWDRKNRIADWVETTSPKIATGANLSGHPWAGPLIGSVGMALVSYLRRREEKA